MRTRKFILRRFTSGKLRLTPERARCLREIGAGEGAGVETPRPGEFLRPKCSSGETLASDPKKKCDSKRLIFVSLLPGRCTRCTAAVIAGTLLLFDHATFAATRRASFDAANASFAEGKFAEAARDFASVLATDGYSAPILYNLANARFREGKPGEAILNYERALVLAPGDPDIVANLRLARTKAGLSAGKPARTTRFAQSLSLNAWASWAAVALFLLCAAVPWQRRRRGIRAALGLGGAAAAILLMTALCALWLRWPDLNRAVVITKDCAARISPVTVGEVVFRLAEGEAVTVRRTRGNYTLVQSPDGHTGWVSRNEIGDVLASVER